MRRPAVFVGGDLGASGAYDLVGGAEDSLVRSFRDRVRFLMYPERVRAKCRVSLRKLLQCSPTIADARLSPLT
jgi:hypothetical protein